MVPKDGIRVQTRDGAALFEALVAAGAKADAITGTAGGALKISVKARPIEGRANRAVIEIVAARLGLPKTRVGLVRGATSRRKVLAIEGMDPETLASMLCADAGP